MNTLARTITLFASLAIVVAGPRVAVAQEPAPPTAPPPAAPPPAAPPVPPPAEPPEPLAGYANGSFFLRDPGNWFVLFPKGRVQVDSYIYLNRGDPPMGVDDNSSKDPRPRDTLFIRRARIEMQGTFAKIFDWMVAGEFGTTPASGAYGTFTDCFITLNLSDWAQLQAGQFDAPFTLENRTSDKLFDFMERSIPVRSFAAPTNKEAGAMLWGYAPSRLFYYSAGVFDGDGQAFKNLDNKPAIIGRAFVAPLAPFARDRKWLEQLWVGGSVWWEQSTNLGGAVAPSASGATQADLPGMSTQGGFGFFSSNYAGTSGRAHLTPGAETLKWAVEANVPWRKLGLRFELVHVGMDLAQYNDATPMGGSLTRSGPISGGRLDGLGYYVELYGWILGEVDYLGVPGQQPAPRLKKLAAAKEPAWGLMVAGKFEHVGFDIKGLPPGTPDMMGSATLDPAQGHYGIDVFEVGVNAWLTRHVRLTANYIANFIGGIGADAATDTGSAANLKRNFYFGRAEYELLMRAAIGL